MAQSRVPVVKYPGKEYDQMMKTLGGHRSSRSQEIVSRVEEILENVRKQGDTALFRYTSKFDRVKIDKNSVRISQKELSAAASNVSPSIREAIVEAAKRIEAYHRKQTPVAFNMRSPEGTLSQLIRPLARVGVYIPGGYTVYPSTVLMDVIPARIAGVAQIAAATPARKELDPALAFALVHLKVKEVYRIGGAQAVAAFAFGTDSVPQVDKVVGPGNAYVAEAKRQVYGQVDIDSIAGPSEVVVVADTSANPHWVALDLLAQAEHGTGDEVAFCVTESAKFAHEIREAVMEEIERSPSPEVFANLSEYAITIVVASSRRRSMQFVNDCAPEHLQIMTRTAEKDLNLVQNAGAVFLGEHTPVALGDYFVGTNHVLPTGGSARFASGLGVASFQKRISVAGVHARGLGRAAPHVSALARAEGFVHHALSVERRVQPPSAK